MSRPRRHTPAVVVAALALALAASVGAWAGAIGGGAAGARAMGPLPACRYDNILTTPRLYADWSITLVDTILRVPSTYTPPDLVPVSDAGLAGPLKIRSIAIEDLAAMTEDAEAAGAPIGVQSAYRSFNQQKATFDYWVSKDGYKGALKVSARPGHSEHQLGLAIDFKSAAGGPPWEGSDWALSPAGKWMKANAWKYGWLLSYPKGKFDLVCYSYEPWHYRYVGRELAAKIHASGLTIREYLWANFTTAVVPPPSASGSPSASPSLAPSPSPDVTASPIVPGTLPPLTLPTVPPTLPPTPAPTAEPAPATTFPGSSATVIGVLVLAAVATLFGVGLARRRR